MLAGLSAVSQLFNVPEGFSKSQLLESCAVRSAGLQQPHQTLQQPTVKSTSLQDVPLYFDNVSKIRER